MRKKIVISEVFKNPNLLEHIYMWNHTPNTAAIAGKMYIFNYRSNDYNFTGQIRRDTMNYAAEYGSF